ncbi:MAG: PIN domain-containing protein [Gaiellaceae bacterium]
MGAVLLDTTVLIDLLRGREGARARLHDLRATSDVAWVCAVNVEETVRGLLPRERDPAGALFAGVRIAPLGAREGWQAGEWRRDFARRGKTLAQADCLVAAATLSIGGRLATGNPKDYPMTKLQIEHWPVGA